MHEGDEVRDFLSGQPILKGHHRSASNALADGGAEEVITLGQQTRLIEGGADRRPLSIGAMAGRAGTGEDLSSVGRITLSRPGSSLRLPGTHESDDVVNALGTHPGPKVNHSCARDALLDDGAQEVVLLDQHISQVQGRGQGVPFATGAMTGSAVAGVQGGSPGRIPFSRCCRRPRFPGAHEGHDILDLLSGQPFLESDHRRTGDAFTGDGPQEIIVLGQHARAVNGRAKVRSIPTGTVTGSAPVGEERSAIDWIGLPRRSRHLLGRARFRRGGSPGPDPFRLAALPVHNKPHQILDLITA